jgi:thiamine pyrophosphate-dependent acetolactate synthase large subunit-like protein
VAPSEDDLRAAAEVLNAGEKVAVLVGIGARDAGDEVVAVADRLGAPIVKSLLGKMVVPDDHALTTGGLGLLGTRPSEELMEECDTLLMVGTSFPYTKYLPEAGKVRVVQIDTDGSRIGMRLPTEVPVVADAKLTLSGLLTRLEQGDRSLRNRYQERMAAWRAKMAALADGSREPVAPQYLMSVLDDLAEDDAILTTDSGTVTTWAARHWTIRGQREFYLSGNLATMAPALPYAIAIQSAYPERQVIAFAGDGGFAMLMAEFLTAVRHGLPVKVVVNNNNAYGQILWEQIVLGYPEYAVRHRQPEADFAQWSRACGGYGAKVTKAGDLREAVAAALEHEGPALVACDVNPDEPPMPGRISYEQARHFTESFLKGQPHKLATLASVARDKISELRS